MRYENVTDAAFCNSLFFFKSFCMNKHGQNVLLANELQNNSSNLIQCI